MKTDKYGYGEFRMLSRIITAFIGIPIGLAINHYGFDIPLNRDNTTNLVVIICIIIFYPGLDRVAKAIPKFGDKS